MSGISNVWRAAARWPAVTLGVVTAALLSWRAYSQSITYDEAFTWLEFVRRPPAEFLNNYTANNHVLFSLLAWTTTRTLGTSEFTLRLPSVAAGVAYVVLCLRLSRVVCRRPALAALTTSALVLNPFVLDFFVAARGYGLATTCLVAALLVVIAVPSHTVRTIAAVGGLLGSSVAANLAYGFPVAGVSVAMAALVSLRSCAPIRTLVQASATLGLALALTAAPQLILPLQHRPPRDAFAFGSDTFLEASRSLVAASLQYDPQDRWSAPDWAVTVLSAGVVPLLLLICTIWCLLGARRGSRQVPLRLDESAVPLFVIGTTIAVTVTALAAAHLILGLPLPFERTGLYWLTLFPLALAALTARGLHSSTERIRRSSVVLGTALALLTVAYAAQFSTTHFRTWRYDAGSREIFTLIAQSRCPTTHQRIVAGTPFRFAPALEFYRVLRGADHIHPLNILQERYAPGEPDFYVSSPRDVHTRPAPAVPIFTHPVSGATLLAHPALAECAIRDP